MFFPFFGQNLHFVKLLTTLEQKIINKIAKIHNQTDNIAYFSIILHFCVSAL